MENINEVIDGIEYVLDISFESVVKESDFLLKLSSELALAEIENAMNLLKKHTTIRLVKEDKFIYNRGIEGEGLKVIHINTFIKLISEKYKDVFITATGIEEY